jgi:hypothetical protein
MPGAEFFQNAENTIRSADCARLVAYDQDTQCGLIFDFDANCWSAASPVSFEAFACLLDAMGVRFNTGRDLDAWLAACKKSNQSSALADGQLAH